MIVEAPKLAFAFNPIRIDISGIGSAETVELTSNGYRFTRESKNGRVSFDVQAIAQSLFDRKEFYKVLEIDTVLHKKLSYTIDDGSTIQTGDIDVIWGALQIGETYSQDKTLVWFKNLPFTVPLYLNGSGEIEIKEDDGAYGVATPLVAGKHNLNISSNAKKVVYLKIEGGIGGGDTSVFDYTFDSTFKAVIKDSALIKLIVRDCTEGVYLRWINKHGEYCYYLFNSGLQSREVKNSDINITEFIRTINFTHNYNKGTNHPVSKEIQRSVKLFTPLADRRTFALLEGLTESPVVDMFMGYDASQQPKWMGVNITAGTFGTDEVDLQDFECTLLMPKALIQSL